MCTSDLHGHGAKLQGLMPFISLHMQKAILMHPGRPLETHVRMRPELTTQTKAPHAHGLACQVHNDQHIAVMCLWVKSIIFDSNAQDELLGALPRRYHDRILRLSLMQAHPVWH